jgi:hypothetical protein
MYLHHAQKDQNGGKLHRSDGLSPNRNGEQIISTQKNHKFGWLLVNTTLPQALGISYLIQKFRDVSASRFWFKKIGYVIYRCLDWLISFYDGY